MSLQNELAEQRLRRVDPATSNALLEEVNRRAESGKVERPLKPKKSKPE